MSTPTLKDEPITYAKIAPNPESFPHSFIARKIAEGQLHCQECFNATGDRIAVQLRFEGDRAIFHHDNCVLTPPNPKPLAIAELVADEPTGLNRYPVTEEGWTWDPPVNIGDRCIIVDAYYQKWLFDTSEAKGQARKIEDSYDGLTGEYTHKWNNNTREREKVKISSFDWCSAMTLLAIKDDMAKVQSEGGNIREMPLKVLWTLEKSAIAT